MPTIIPYTSTKDTLIEDVSPTSLANSDSVDLDAPQDSDTHFPQARFDLFSVSTDKLFFTGYILTNTLWPRWYLV